MSYTDQKVWTAAAGLTIEQWARERLLPDLTGSPADAVAAEPGTSEERWITKEIRRHQRQEFQKLLDGPDWTPQYPFTPSPPAPFTIPRAERPNLEEVISEVEPASIWGTTSAPEAPMLTEELFLAAIDQLRGKRRKTSERPEPSTQPPLALRPPKPRKILV